MSEHRHPNRWRRLIDWPYWALDLGVASGITIATGSFALLIWSLS